MTLEQALAELGKEDPCAFPAMSRLPRTPLGQEVHDDRRKPCTTSIAAREGPAKITPT